MFRFKVTPDASTGLEPFEYECTSRDLLQWERVSKRTIKFLLTEMPIVELYRLAHLTAKRMQLYTGSLQEFERDCDLYTDKPGDADAETDESGGAVAEGPLDPTPPVRSIGAL